MQTDWAVPAEWAMQVYQAIDQFIAETGIRKEALARALGVHASSLTLSHIQDPQKSRYIYQRLPYVLHRDRFFRIARTLYLSPEGCRALTRLVSQILSVSSGYPLDPDCLLKSDYEAIEMGLMGAEFFDAARWELALPYLQQSSSFLETHTLEADSRAFYTFLRVGTQLASWQSYSGQTEATAQTVQKLLARTKSYRGEDRKTWEAICLLNKAAATAFRHNGWHPELVIAHSRNAYRISQEKQLERSNRIAALRDQAKPYVLWGFKETNGSGRHRFAEALEILDQAEREAGGSVPDEEAREEWLFTQLTRIECLSAIQEGVEAHRVWEATMALAWVDDLLNKSGHSPLKAKLAFAEIAIRLSQHDMDGLASIASIFCTDPANKPYGDRYRRMTAMTTMAETGNRAALQRLLIT